MNRHLAMTLYCLLLAGSSCLANDSPPPARAKFPAATTHLPTNGRPHTSHRLQSSSSWHALNPQPLPPGPPDQVPRTITSRFTRNPVAQKKGIIIVGGKTVAHRSRHVAHPNAQR